MSFFYLPLNQVYVDFRTVHVRTSVPPEKLQRDIESSIQALAPDIAVKEMQTMLQSLQGLNGFFLFRFGAELTTTMGLLGLILAVVGVYSVVSYAAVQRTHEIGIRMALGGQRNDMLRLILGRGAQMAVIGVAVGIVGSLALTRLMANLLFGVSAYDPLTFLAVAGLLVLVALAACYIPARRAMKVDPLVALRYE
jgi:putative ABC transport system permease protein